MNLGWRITATFRHGKALRRLLLSPIRTQIASLVGSYQRHKPQTLFWTVYIECKRHPWPRRRLKARWVGADICRKPRAYGVLVEMFRLNHVAGMLLVENSEDQVHCAFMGRLAPMPVYCDSEY